VALVPISARGAKKNRSFSSVIRGVQIGARSYSYRDRDLDACIEAFKAVGGRLEKLSIGAL
jgi:hypothetical protein